MKRTAYFFIATLCIATSVFTVDSSTAQIEMINVNGAKAEYENVHKRAQELKQEASNLHQDTSIVKEQLKDVAKLASLKNEDSEEGSSRGNYHRKVYIGMDLSQNCGYSKSQIEKIVKGTALEGTGEYALAAEHIYGVNALFIVSLAQHESGNGTSSLAKHKNNLFGLGAYDASPYESAIRYGSKQECIMDFARIISKKYFGSGRRSLSEIGKIYASDPKWPERIARIMNTNEQKILK